MPELIQSTGILIADPDSRAMEPVKTVLQKLGYELHWCGSSKEARKLSGERFFHVVLLSGDLFHGSEKDLVPAIKELCPETVVLVMVSPGAAQSALEAMNLGADGCLVKPLDMREVLKKVRHAVEKQSLEHRYKTLFHGVGDSIFIHDSSGCLYEVNRSAAEALGYSVKELLGRNFQDLECPQSGLPFSDRMEKMRKKGTLIHEVLFSPSSGESFLAECCSRPMVVDNKPLVLTVARDITERKGLEVQLRHAQKMEAIGTLAGGIAHDFNNILGTIIGYAEMMDIFDVAEDSPLKPQISEILGAAERARNLVRQILTFSRQTEKEPIRTSLIPLVKEAMVFLRASLPSTIRFEVDVPREAGEVMADPTQIYQMLMNLCTNASHSMREKGGTLTVALEEEDIPKEGVPGFPEARPGTAVRLTVTDTGEGIPAEALENIFDPYYTTREGGDGAGLGLAVVHGIVTGHGGAIRVESELDGGTSFSVYLPRIADQGAGAGKSTGDGRKSLLPTGTESILFVDDEDPLCNWGRMILSRLGYQVDCETAGERALDLVLRDPEKYDLIITDETMPGMQGSVLAEKLLESKSGIPVILCSGHGSMMNIADYREKGVARLLAKPLGARVLADVVRQVLDESKIQGARE